LEALTALRGDGKAEVLDKFLLPVDSAVAELASVELLDSSAYYFLRGQAVMEPDLYRSGEEGDMGARLRRKWSIFRPWRDYRRGVR